MSGFWGWSLIIADPSYHQPSQKAQPTSDLLFSGMFWAKDVGVRRAWPGAEDEHACPALACASSYRTNTRRSLDCLLVPQQFRSSAQGARTGIIEAFRAGVRKASTSIQVCEQAGMAGGTSGWRCESRSSRAGVPYTDTCIPNAT